MLENHGVRFTGNSEYLMSKVFATRFEKYCNNIREIYKNLNIISIEEEGEITIKCDVCNNLYKIKTTFLRLRHLRYKVNPCIHCNPNNSYNYSGENEIYEFLNSLNLNIIRNNRSILNGKELDIFLPDKNIAIEFNGLYWHSELYVDKKYHLNKKLNCEKLNINLIHVWEDDWIYKKDIVKSRISNLIGINNKIFARKCKVVKIDSKNCRNFLNNNHLQGNINSSYNIGLIYNGEIVSVMTFGKFRRCLGKNSEENKWELYRFCNKLNTSVIGAFSKLLKYFEEDISPSNIITYANRDWSSNENVYEKSGFKFVSHTDINYWYFTKDIKRMHRFNFRKDKLVKNGFDKNKTEKEIMLNRGYYRIFDCGNLKYQKSFGN